MNIIDQAEATRLLRDAVIEAAKVWAQNRNQPIHGTTADSHLYEAVEALETAEGK